MSLMESKHTQASSFFKIHGDCLLKTTLFFWKPWTKHSTEKHPHSLWINDQHRFHRFQRPDLRRTRDKQTCNTRAHKLQRWILDNIKCNPCNKILFNTSSLVLDFTCTQSCWQRLRLTSQIPVSLTRKLDVNVLNAVVMSSWAWFLNVSQAPLTAWPQSRWARFNT